MKVDLRVPHFLRVTQALALVSGFGLPLVMGCGGSASPTPGADGSSDDAAIGVGGGVGIPPHDGAVTGVVAEPDATVAYDGAVTGIGIYDGGPTGVAIYDGGPLGIIVPFDGGHVIVGGPLPPPELPA